VRASFRTPWPESSSRATAPLFPDPLPESGLLSRRLARKSRRRSPGSTVRRRSAPFRKKWPGRGRPKRQPRPG